MGCRTLHAAAAWSTHPTSHPSTYHRSPHSLEECTKQNRDILHLQSGVGLAQAVHLHAGQVAKR